MPFDPEVTATPTSIGALQIVLSVPAGGTGTDTEGEYRFSVLDQNGEEIRTRRGDLAPHLSAAEKQSIANFMDALLAKATASLP